MEIVYSLSYRLHFFENCSSPLSSLFWSRVSRRTTHGGGCCCLLDGARRPRCRHYQRAYLFSVKNYHEKTARKKIMLWSMYTKKSPALFYLLPIGPNRYIRFPHIKVSMGLGKKHARGNYYLSPFS